jgi:PiT family inorganic phosphate transporter
VALSCHPAHRYDAGPLSFESAAPLIAACIFALISGFNDGGNLLASFTSGRVITPPAAAALLLVSVGGPIVLGTSVARTIGTNVIDLRGQGELGYVLIILSPLSVVLLSWRFGIPTSMTLALVGGMIGWVLASGGTSGLSWTGVARVLIGIPVSVAAGCVLALVVYRAIRRFLGAHAHAAVLRIARLQFLTAAVQSFAYGANDMEKSIGLIAVGLSFANQHAPVSFSGPVPIIGAFVFFCVGALVGGWRVASRIGFGVLKVRPAQALAQQFASGSVVGALAVAGAPVSMTQTIDGGLVGVGAALRASSVRWGIVREMLGSWLLTLPLAVIVAAMLHFAVRLLGLAP